MLLYLLIILLLTIEPIITRENTENEVKVCDSESMQLTLKRLNDVNGKNRWLGNISSTDRPLLHLIEFKIDLNTYGSNASIVPWDRYVTVVKTESSYNTKKPDTAALVNPKDVAHFSETRTGHSFTVEASWAIVQKNYLAFVIELTEQAAFPVVDRLSIFDLEVCPRQLAAVQNGTQSCGKKMIRHEQLITHGSGTSEGDWPWHCAIFHSQQGTTKYRCGCTLINSNTVVTVAHCVMLLAVESVLVHLGRYDIDITGPNTQQFRVSKIIVHHKYSLDFINNDIALIRLANEAIFNRFVQPICLWDYNRRDLNEVIGRKGISVGWGLNEHQKINKMLLEVAMPVVSFINCLKSDPLFATFLDRNTFCAGFRNGSSPCNGDSGGGMYFEDNGIYKLRGIVTFVKASSGGECDSMEYTVLTDIARYLDWIEENLRDTPIVADTETEVNSELKICESDSVQFTLMKLNDMPGRNRWLGNITDTDHDISLSDKTIMHLELDTSGRIPQILDWDRDIQVLRLEQKYFRVKHNPSMLVNPRDIAYFSQPRTGYSFTIEAFGTNDVNNYLTFVIDFDDVTAFPVVERLSVSGVEVCSHSPLVKVHQTVMQMKGTISCGAARRKKNQLITNGFGATEGDWPWHCAIFHADGFQQSYKCGCTLINSNTVVTAAHCVNFVGQTLIAERVLVHLGQYDIDLAGPNTQQFRAYRVIVHPNFNYSNFQNDIALLRLANEATFNAFVKPICLWESSRTDLREVIGKNGIAVGWGFNERHQLNKVLHQVFMPVVSDKVCLKSNPGFYADSLTGSAFCAGFRNGSSVCNGDSGGGLYFEENGIYKLRGIVSVSVAESSVENFCVATEFIVFTDVAGYLDWIEAFL